MIFNTKIKKNQKDQSKNASAAVRNYNNNYYGDQVCLPLLAKDKKA